ncbi:MAG: U32 family peptidase [Ruminococcus sp.]|nr:U32 family peptidase [Ruminococcus sp.]
MKSGLQKHKTMNATEILAPAGSMESLVAAVNCGANAVYIGGKSFSARQNAANFEEAELKEAADFCHLRNVKLYLTVNTIILDNQINEFSEFIKMAAKCGVDAFIVQDMGACRIIRNTVPDAAIHGSTQMTVHTVNGALFLKQLGFKRVVLARELSEKKIKKISALGIETEVFVHGALCMSVSGQCYLSSLIGQRSANRGLCAQPCRLPFSSCKTPEYTALSLKDLSLMKHLQTLESMGVTSFKIEGRMKRPEYVASAVSACVQAVNGETPDMSLLKAVFSRSGFTDGYFTGKTDKMFGHREKEDVIAAAKILPEIRQKYTREIKAHKISFKAFVKSGQPVTLKAVSGSHEAVVTGDIPEAALKKPIDADYLERQLSKLGGTVFEFDGLSAEIDDGLMLTAKSINSLRREAVELIGSKIISGNTPEYSSGPLDIELQNKTEELSEIRAGISCIAQLEAAKNADMIIMPADVFLKAENLDFSKVIIQPPRFIYDEEKTVKILAQCREKGAEHLMCNNIAYLKTGKELDYRLHGDFGLNVSNSLSLEFYRENGLSDCTLSFEMKLSQINQLKKSIPTGIIAYGFLPAMLTRNCPIKNETGCKNCRNILFDRKGCENRVVCYGDYVEILNSQCLYMADRLEEIKNVSFITLYFTNETAEKTASIINEYKTAPKKQENITRGLYYRGIL